MSGETQLVQRTLAGDEAAFRQLVDTYKAYVYAIILNLVHEQQEAENIAQEVFFQAYRALPQFQLHSFKSWIGKIALHKAIDWQRKHKRQPKEESLAYYQENIPNQEAESQDPAAIVLEREKKSRVRDVCQGLPDVYGHTLIKFYLEGKSYQEIAAEEDTTVKTVESRLYRARLMFKERWGRDEECI